jgi:hypothetical protein
VFPGAWIGRGEGALPGLRRSGRADPMTRRAWEYLNADSYTLNSYGKPALSLQTLEGLLGEEPMTRALRTYARRWRFGHPTSEDFVAAVSEAAGRDMRWYFQQTWASSELCDYAVAVRHERPRQGAGYFEQEGRRLAFRPPARGERDAQGAWESEVTVRRLGEVRLPVELLVEFEDGRAQRESWDGQERWRRFRYQGAARGTRAALDPERKIALDVNPANNTWVEERGAARRAARKWSGRWLFWLQNLLELHLVLG